MAGTFDKTDARHPLHPQYGRISKQREALVNAQKDEAAKKAIEQKAADEAAKKAE